ncbi:Zinc-regulated GTPase metalloprotein activator [Pleurotus pulmonarius]
MASTQQGGSPIPITVFTGFLGAGKTSVILSLLPQLPNDYKVVLLKNEFGDIEVDSKLAEQSSLTAVSEILNGCMCCVLVGQMQNALLEIRDKYRPDRIIIECSGSAFPATLAFQIRELERQTSGDLKLDSIVTVVDAENFQGYEDSSPTAKMQASYTDILLINKWEHVSERALDMVIDHLNTLNDETPKIKCRGRDGVDPDLIFGIETQLFNDSEYSSVKGHHTHNEEVETVTIQKRRPEVPCNCSDNTHDHNGNIEVATTRNSISSTSLDAALASVSKELVWRIKGFVRLETGVHILNWAFGRYDLTPSNGTYLEGDEVLRLTVMGERGEVKRAARRFATSFDADVV